MLKIHVHLMLLALAALAAGCAAESPSLEDARDAYFATVDGNDQDCTDWLQWCIDEGYPQDACEERNEYCLDGQWLGGDRGDDDRGDDDDSADPCAPVADAAYDDCIANGGTEDECRAAERAAYADCVDG